MNVLSWLAAGAAGWFWVHALLPRVTAPAWIRHTLAASVAPIFGTGATASLFFALLWAGASPTVAAWTSDALILASGAAVWMLRRRRATESAPANPACPVPLAWLGGVAAAVCALAFLAGVFVVLTASPQGDWDAWTVWNVRARFLAHEGLWRNAVSPELAFSHPEFPLLWSAAVARAWSESGAIAQAAPQAGALLASLALLLLFASSIAVRASWQWAALAASALLMTTSLWRSAPGQLAEVPLAAMMLASVVCALLSQQAGWSAPALALSGALASMAAFTKNEGLAFLVFLAVPIAAVARLRALWWFAGAGPVLMLSLAFRFLLAPDAQMVSGESFRQLSRLWAALQGMAAELWKLGDFPAHPLLFTALLFLVFRPTRPWRPLWPVLPPALLLVADIVFLWGSPEDQANLLRSAGDRLWLQAMPMLLLCAFLWLAQAEPESTKRQPSPEERRKTKPASVAKR